MSETLKTEKNIREYLLGRVTDDAKLAEYEEFLFSDDEFCELAEVTEDSLINDFVFGRLSASDNADFVKTLENNSDRRSKVALTRALKVKAAEQPVAASERRPSFFDSIRSFFSQPMYAGGFALLVIAVLVGSIFVLRSSPDELTNLKEIYKKERPVEPRITGFDYAPLVVTRGAADDANKNKLELEKTRFLQAVVENPTAANFHKLGVFYLTQQNYKDAIENLDKAVKLDDKNATFQNDLGTAYFELARQSKDDKLLNLSRANEAFSSALKINSDSLEALFNRSLVLQEMGLRNQATESWNLYLQKDPSSQWADEARKNLERIKQIESGSTKTKEQVLEDFLTAYGNQNWQFAERIHNSTKGMLNGISPFEQITRRYLDARKARDALTMRESLDAMNYIGNLEKEKHADFFYAELADYYSKVDDTSIDNLLRAKDLWADGYRLIKGDAAVAITKFEESEKLFEQSANENEAKLAQLWAAQMLIYDAKLDESARRMSLILAEAKSKQHKTIEANLLYWIGVCNYRQREFSRSITNVKAALLISEKGENEHEIDHSSEYLATAYRNLGELEKSLEYIAIAMDTDGAYYTNSSNTWRSLNTAATLLGDLRDLKSSIDFSKESLYLAKLIFDDKPGLNDTMRHLTVALERDGQFDAALQTADVSIDLALKRERTAQNDAITARTYLTRANVKRSIGSCEDALGDYQNALVYYRDLSEVVQHLYDLHKGQLLCVRKLRRSHDFESEFNTFLAISEEYRKNIREDETRQSFFDSEQVVFDAAIAHALEQDNSKKSFEYAEVSRARSLLEFVKSGKPVAEVEKDFASVSRPLTISEIQSRLSEHAQIVQYQLLDGKLTIWLITKTRFELTQKQIESIEFERLISDYRQSIIDQSDPQKRTAYAKRLYEIVIPDTLERDKTLCLVPDKTLHQIPFASLISPADEYLIEEYELVYSPSSSIFVIASENAHLKKDLEESLLSIGNPQFDLMENPKLKDLPEAEIEVARIAQNYSKAVNFVEKDATKKAFLNNLESSSVIHFAGHFVANDHSTSNSKMLFTDEDMRVFELADKKLPRSKLIVLSACETGLEKINQSEGAISAARTFLALGTPVVVASSWKVDSEATKDLMIAFHNKRRVERLSTAAALRQAQLEMIQTKEFNAPFYWSAFSATGGLANY